jgi:hypothetical protein
MHAFHPQRSKSRRHARKPNPQLCLAFFPAIVQQIVHRLWQDPRVRVMKVVAYDTARVTVLFPFEEVAPMAGASARAVVDAVANRYSFAKLPDFGLPKTEIDKSGIRFETGVLETNAGPINIIDFTVFGDGVVIGAKTTEDGELFWSDAFNWLRAEHGFRNFNTPPDLRFLSQIVVEFERPLAKLMANYAEISSSVSKVISKIYDEEIPMGFARFDLEFDKIGSKSSLVVPKFIIERRVLIPFERERYICGAPMRTLDHIAILEEIERSLY